MGLSLVELLTMFPECEPTERRFANSHSPSDACCQAQGPLAVEIRSRHKPQPYRGRAGRRDFHVKPAALMQESNLKYETWAFPINPMTTSLKGVSVMKLHRALKITPKPAWPLAHRIRNH